MAWQDELNSLDQGLSAGRIKPDEYRRRRDELLAAASSSNQVGLRRGHRQQPPSIANAFNGDANPKSQGEVTQQVKMPSPAPAWRATPPPDAPRPITSTPAPPVQGSEVFGLSVNGPSRTRPRFLRFIIAIVVLALIGAATWWFAFRGGEEAPPSAGAGSSPPVEFSLDRLPNPADVALSTLGVLTVDQAQVADLIKPDEANYLVEGGAQKIYYRGATDGNTGHQIFVVETASPDKSKRVLDGVAGRAKNLGFTDVKLDGLPGAVTVRRLDGEKASLYEGVYVSGRYAVRIVVIQNGEPSERHLNAAFTKTVRRVTDTVKPS